MGKHVHDEIGTGEGHLSDWTARRMARHLREVHSLALPMSWDIGQLHRAHLDDHTKGIAVAPIDPFEDATCGAWYGTGEHGPNGWAVCQRPPGHPEVSEDGIGHSPQPIPIQPKAQEAPMTQTDPIPTVTPPTNAAAERSRAAFVQMACADALEDEAKALMLDKFPGANWDTALPETKNYWITQVRLRAKRDAEQKPEPNRQILVDRLIAVMAGLDFDTQWASDHGIGPSARGLVREQYGAAADRMLRWLERGGAMILPPYASLGEDLERERALVTDLEEVNNQLRQDLAGAQAGLSAMEQQMAIDQREHGASLDAVQRKLEESEQRRQGLFQEMGEIRQRLDMTQTASTNLQGQVRGLREANDRQVQTITALEEQLAEATDERDRAQQALMAKLTEAGELREERDEWRNRFDRLEEQDASRQGQLRELVARLGRDSWGGSRIFRQLKAILGEEAVSTGSDQGGDVSVTPEQPILIRGDASGVRHLTWEEAQAEDAAEADQLAALSEGYLLDDISWARQFAEGGEA